MRLVGIVEVEYIHSSEKQLLQHSILVGSRAKVAMILVRLTIIPPASGRDRHQYRRNETVPGYRKVAPIPSQNERSRAMGNRHHQPNPPAQTTRVAGGDVLLCCCGKDSGGQLMVANPFHRSGAARQDGHGRQLPTFHKS